MHNTSDSDRIVAPAYFFIQRHESTHRAAASFTPQRRSVPVRRRNTSGFRHTNWSNRYVAFARANVHRNAGQTICTRQS